MDKLLCGSDPELCTEEGTSPQERTLLHRVGQDRQMLHRLDERRVAQAVLQRIRPCQLEDLKGEGQDRAMSSCPFKATTTRILASNACICRPKWQPCNIELLLQRNTQCM